MTITDCLFPAHSAGGGGAGYYYGGGGGSAYAAGNATDGAQYSPGGGGGGSSYIDPSVRKISLTSGATWGVPIAAPVYDTATTITTSPNPSYAGGPVTVTTQTTVVGTGRPVVFGTVQIRSGGTLLATVPVGTNGEATWTTTDLPAGNVSLSATFLSSEDPSVAYRASSSDGGLNQVVHDCAPTPTFLTSLRDEAATSGTSIVLDTYVSVSPVYEGTPQVRWQTSADGGTTWTDAVGTGSVRTDGFTAGTAQATFTFAASGPPRDLKYRAIASTCGGAATSNAAKLTVRGIIFNLSSLPAKTFGSAPFDVASYASGSNVPVAFTSDTPAACAVTGTQVAVLAAGTCTLTASEDGSNGYYPAPEVQQSFTTAKKTITVVAAASPLSQPYGTASAPTVSCTSKGFLGSDGFVTTPNGTVGGYANHTYYRSITINETTAQGSYVAHCSGGNPGPSYTIGNYQDGTFMITAPPPLPLKVTANDAHYTYGTNPPALDATYSVSTTNVTGTLSCHAYASSDTGYGTPLTLSEITPAGSYAIHCTGLASSSYTLSWADGTLIVDPAPVIVTASSPPAQELGNTSAPTVTCSGTGFIGSDGFLIDPAGAVYDVSGTDPVDIASDSGPGDYITKCAGGDPGSNYVIDNYVAGTFTIKDTTAPVVTVPADMTVEATGPDGATAAFTATAKDAVDGLTDVTCDPASGTTLALGVTEVTCASSDAAGNTDTVGFTITVQDTTAPVVAVPADKTLEATGPDGAKVAFTATAKDAVDGATDATCAPASGTIFALGTTQVTCKSTDAAGNTDTGSFTITVQDTTAPDTNLADPELTDPTNQTAASFTCTGSDAVG
ncbi:MAG: HYR domain-containing protein, partial [Nocardioidaceae bacterium]